MSDPNEPLLDINGALLYLREKWGIPTYSSDAFKMHRKRWKIEPTFRGRTSTFWSKADLDLLPKPDKSRPRKQRDASLFTSTEALAYLAAKWDTSFYVPISSGGIDAAASLKRLGARSSMKRGRELLWNKEELDRIEKPTQPKTRARKKENKEVGDNDVPTSIFALPAKM